MNGLYSKNLKNPELKNTPEPMPKIDEKYYTQ